MRTLTQRILSLLDNGQACGLKEAVALAQHQEREWLQSVSRESRKLSCMTYTTGAAIRERHRRETT